MVWFGSKGGLPTASYNTVVITTTDASSPDMLATLMTQTHISKALPLPGSGIQRERSPNVITTTT